MKVFLVVLLCGLVSLCCAEPPRFRSSRLRSRVLSRQELAPSEAPAADPASGPYPPSGWKPEGETLELPTETEAPVPEYGPPPTEYGPPTNEYGPPAVDDPEAEEPVPETVIPLGQNGRLRSSYLLLVDPATLQRAQIVSRRAPAMLRRSRF